MRVLSVRQPWALHIVQSGKDVENRTRNIAGSYRGLVAIHAGRIPDEDALGRLPRLPSNGIPRIFHYGAIIGVATLVDVHSSGPTYCHLLGKDEPGMCSEWAEAGRWHLVFARPQRLRRPLPFAGSLGLRTLDTDTVRALGRIGFLPPPVPGKER
jgi:hypothetical protein